MTARSPLLFVAATVAILVAACAGAPSPSPAGSADPGPIAVGSPSPSPTPATQPDTEPSATPAGPSATPEPTPTPAPAVWSKARTIKSLNGCNTVVATVDDGGTSHVAAQCGGGEGQIRYATSTDGVDWVLDHTGIHCGCRRIPPPAPLRWRLTCCSTSTRPSGLR